MRGMLPPFPEPSRVFLQQLPRMAQGHGGTFVAHHARQFRGALLFAQRQHGGDGAPFLQPLFHALLVGGLGRDLVEMGDDQKLVAARQLGEGFAHAQRRGPADAGVELVEYQHRPRIALGQGAFQGQHDA